ncbi:MAG: hypothetical protein AABY11_00940 [archaeon]
METPKKIIFVRCVSALAIVVGTLVMAAWVFQVPFLKSFIFDVITMKFRTALCFLFSGIILYTMTARMDGRKNLKKYLLLIFSALILLIMIPSFIAISTGSYFDAFRPILLLSSDYSIEETYLEMPSIGTIIAFIFIGLSSTFVYAFPAYSRFFLLYAGSIVHFLATIAIIGFLIRSPLLYYEIQHISAGMSLHAAILFLLLGIGFLLLGETKNKVCPHFKGMVNEETLMCTYDWKKHK